MTPNDEQAPPPETPYPEPNGSSAAETAAPAAPETVADAPAGDHPSEPVAPGAQEHQDSAAPEALNPAPAPIAEAEPEPAVEPKPEGLVEEVEGVLYADASKAHATIVKFIKTHSVGSELRELAEAIAHLIGMRI